MSIFRIRALHIVAPLLHYNFILITQILVHFLTTYTLYIMKVMFIIIEHLRFSIFKIFCNNEIIQQ